LSDASGRIAAMAAAQQVLHTTADEALELAVAEKPLLVVMDIRLSGNRDGIDVALGLFTGARYSQHLCNGASDGGCARPGASRQPNSVAT
jgi:hypothetical protein